MPGSVIVGGARTPIGKLSGALKGFTAMDLGGFAIKAALERSGVSGDQVDYVIMGQVLQAGAGQMPARQSAVNAGIPMDVPSITINKVCLSGLDAIALADQLIRAGEVEIVVAGGQESMTNAPHLLMGGRKGYKYGPTTVLDSVAHDGLTDALTREAMGELTEAGNAERAIARAPQDEAAAASHQRAARAQAEGVFDAEIAPIEIPQRKGEPLIVAQDEGVRPETTAESLGALKPAFQKTGDMGYDAIAIHRYPQIDRIDHVHHGGNSSGIVDGAAAVLIGSKEAGDAAGLTPRARILGAASIGSEPTIMLTGPALVTEKLLARLGMTTGDIDVYELNEAFAAVGIASTRKLGVEADRVNVDGGAIAIGHPLGMSGTRLALHLAYALKARGGGTGVAALCGGGGQGEALILSS